MQVEGKPWQVESSHRDHVRSEDGNVVYLSVWSAWFVHGNGRSGRSLMARAIGRLKSWKVEVPMQPGKPFHSLAECIAYAQGWHEGGSKNGGT